MNGIDKKIIIPSIIQKRLDSNNNSVTLNDTYLNTIEIFNELFKKITTLK